MSLKIEYFPCFKFSNGNTKGPKSGSASNEKVVCRDQIRTVRSDANSENKSNVANFAITEIVSKQFFLINKNLLFGKRRSTGAGSRLVMR